MNSDVKRYTDAEVMVAIDHLKVMVTQFVEDTNDITNIEGIEDFTEEAEILLAEVQGVYCFLQLYRFGFYIDASATE
jgi:hypothetical protein